MTYTAEQLIATNQANVHALKGLTIHAYAGFQKLVELNLAASKAVFAESFSHTQALLGAKHPQQLVALQVGLVQPLTQKSIAYGRHVYAVVAETGTEFSNAFEAKLAEAQTAFSALVEDFAQNAPSGTESAVALFKTAVNASKNVIESAQSSAKKAVEVAESNFTVVANQAVNAANKASKTH